MRTTLKLIAISAIAFTAFALASCTRTQATGIAPPPVDPVNTGSYLNPVK